MAALPSTAFTEYNTFLPSFFLVMFTSLSFFAIAKRQYSEQIPFETQLPLASLSTLTVQRLPNLVICGQCLLLRQGRRSCNAVVVHVDSNYSAAAQAVHSGTAFDWTLACVKVAISNRFGTPERNVCPYRSFIFSALTRLVEGLCTKELAETRRIAGLSTCKARGHIPGNGNE